MSRSQPLEFSQKRLQNFVENFANADHKTNAAARALREMLEVGFDINTVDENDCNILHHAVLWRNGLLIAEIFKSEIDIEQKNNKQETALDLAIADASYYHLPNNSNLIVEYLLSKGAKLNRSNPKFLEVLGSIFVEDQKAALFSQAVSDFSVDEKNKIIQALDAMLFLNWAYSYRGYLMNVKKTLQLLNKFSSQNDMLEENNAVFLQALEIMQKGFGEVNDQTIMVVEAPYKNHVAFFIIFADKNFIAQKFLYCDSYCALDLKEDERRYNHAVCGFEILEPRFSTAELQGKISRTFKEAVYLKDDQLPTPAKIQQAFERVFGKIKYLENSEDIPTKKQAFDRSICALKSTSVVMRVIAKLISGEEYFLNKETGKPSGALYDRYKTFKKDSINQAIEVLMDFAQNNSELYGKSLARVLDPFIKTADRKIANKGETDGVIEPVNVERLKKLQLNHSL